jgi:hypothetical protein
VLKLFHNCLGANYFVKYADLIDSNNLTYSEKVFNQKTDEKFTIRRPLLKGSFFINFIPKQWKNKYPKPIRTNWKARLSIHPEDFDKAWEIVLPILLSEKNTAFKVANRTAFEKFKNDREKKLSQLIEEYNLFLHSSNSQNITALRNIYCRLSEELSKNNNSKWQLISFLQINFTRIISFFNQWILNREDLFSRIKDMYESLIDLYKQKLKNSLRMNDGMQFTIYILPGAEKENQNMLTNIENNLIKEGVRAGVIFPTDRQIGIYSSIRHPGKWYYHPAADSSLETYNPDNVDDPFSFLKTLPTAELMQQDQAHEAVECTDSPRLIINALRTKKFIAPSILKALAIHKENIVAYIKTSPLTLRKELITNCLDKSTNLGKLFRVRRGLFTPQLGQGTLKQIEDIAVTSELKN